MNKTLKYTIYGLGGLAGLLLLGLAVIAATFNPNDYKPLIVKLVKEKKGRTLNIEGDIKLAFWPKLGADLGRVSLSDHQAQSEFASMQSAKVFVAVMPLLKKQLVVDTVRIDGLKANIVRFKDGSTNFDDLLSKEESADIKFDIDGVLISRGVLNLKDEIGARAFSISNANISVGHIAKNEPIELDAQFRLQGNNPVINADTKLKGVLLANAAAQQFGAKDLDLALQGDVATLKGLNLKLSGSLDAKPQAMTFVADKLKLVAKANIQGKNIDFLLEAPQLSAQKDQISGKEARLSLTQTQGDDSFTAKLALADIKGSPKTFQSSGVSGEFSGKQGARTLSGNFASPFSGNLDAMVFALPRLAGRVDVKDPTLPHGGMQSSFNVNAHADVKQQQATLQLNANIDGSKLNGQLAVAGFARPRFKFELNADVLDLNKMLGHQQKPQAAAGPARPANWSVLQNLLVEGRLNVGSIIYDKYHVANLALALKADGQTFSLNPLSAKFDDSQIRGSIGIRQFDKPLYSFDLEIDKLDADRYLPPPSANTAASGVARAPDLSLLKAVNATGSLRIGNLKYGKIQASNIRVDLKGDGEKLDINPFSAKIDDSQVKAVLGITRFQDPKFSFDLDIDRLDADRYITRSAPAAQPQQDAAIDLSALKPLNASGEARLGWLKLANLKSENVRLGVKAAAGQVVLSPFSANLYQGSMNGALNVDANVAAITFKQEMKGVAVGPLLLDGINNDMLEGKGTVNLNISTQGNTVATLKKALNGTATFNLADGAIKGVDIAGTVRDIKNKLNFKNNTLGADQKKRTDFSEMLASFTIKNGVAHNEDLSIKAPLLRITGSGDIDIGNATLNYVAKPTVVASLKGQGGTDLDQLNGLTFPLKLTGSFAAPKYGLDFSAIATEIAKKGVLEKVGGSKGDAVQKLISGDQAGAMEDLLSGKDKRNVSGDANKAVSVPANQETPKPASPEDKVKKKLNKLLGF